VTNIMAAMPTSTTSSSVFSDIVSSTVGRRDGKSHRSRPPSAAVSESRLSLPATTSGRRVIAVVYTGVVLVAGLLGAVIGVILPARNDFTTASLGPLAFDANPLTFAIYGMVMVGLTLGVLLGAVQFVSRYDDATPPGEGGGFDGGADDDESESDGGDGGDSERTDG
jgi:hypothetical protein